ncbi:MULTISPECIES: hypothetical protein [unclassified Clostridium]|uniref:hypothetical protein n=1 Tax=unclassified Clostridium TaxID=2614128 RepID=UPI00207A52E0|nr:MULTISPECIES: hypothetical protein [unclassified Clostridium]
MFQKIKQYNVENIDTRFIKIKIWLMHLGENFNGSVFEKSVVEEAIPSLANTPILCFIEENPEGDLDFSDHRMELILEDNEIKTQYLGQAIGIIPETNNAKFEKRLCDDGIEREFLTVEGLIWTKWDEPIDILNNNSIKSQSMELHDDYEGDFKNNLFYFSKFSFFGACVLGDMVEPAMINSTVEVQFSKNNVFEEIQNKFNQFKKFSLEGGNKMKRKEILEKFSYLSNNENYTNIINNENLSDEDLKNKLFALSVSQTRKLIREQLETQKVIKTYWDGEAYETSKWYLEDMIPETNIAIVEDNLDYGKYFGIPYSMEGDLAKLDYQNAKRYIRGDWREFNDGTDSNEVNPMFSNFENELKEKFEKLKTSFKVEETEEYKVLFSDFTKLKEENEALLEFKNNTVATQKEEQTNELFSKFSELEGFEGYSDLKGKAKEMELPDLETKLFALLGKKNFSANSKKQNKKTNEPIKVTVFEKVQEELSEAERRYGLDITKYVKK